MIELIFLIFLGMLSKMATACTPKRRKYKSKGGGIDLFGANYKDASRMNKELFKRGGGIDLFGANYKDASRMNKQFFKR